MRFWDIEISFQSGILLLEVKGSSWVLQSIPILGTSVSNLSFTLVWGLCLPTAAAASCFYLSYFILFDSSFTQQSQSNSSFQAQKCYQVKEGVPTAGNLFKVGPPKPVCISVQWYRSIKMSQKKHKVKK